MRAQLADLKKTEAQRRGEARGSLMVRLQQPVPRLKPQKHLRIDRAQFNAQWLHEQRLARMAQYTQAESTRTNAEPVPQRVIAGPVR